MKPTKERHWRGILREWEQCSLTQRDFCTAKGIAYSTFQYWSKRLKGTAERPRFIAMAKEEKLRPEISILFNNGIRIIVSDSVGFEELSRIISAVSGVLCGSIGTK